MKKNIVTVLTILSVLTTGCAQKKNIEANQGTNNPVGYGQGGTNGSSVTGYGTGGNMTSSGSTAYQNVDPYGNNSYGSNPSDNGNYGNGNGSYTQNSTYGAASGIKNIYFNVDQYAITADKLPIIAHNANLLKSDISKGAKLKIEGHCDASGTDEYNYALGLRRAKSAKDAMIMKGVSAESMRLVSMGESSPECISSTSSGCYAKNRRVEFKVVE